RCETGLMSTPLSTSPAIRVALGRSAITSVPSTWIAVPVAGSMNEPEETTTRTGPVVDAVRRSEKEPVESVWAEPTLAARCREASTRYAVTVPALTAQAMADFAPPVPASAPGDVGSRPPPQAREESRARRTEFRSTDMGRSRGTGEHLSVFFVTVNR